MSRKFFYDALPMAGSTGAVEMMMSLIANKKVESSVAEAWIESLALIQHPTREMISAIVVSNNQSYYYL